MEDIQIQDKYWPATLTLIISLSTLYFFWQKYTLNGILVICLIVAAFGITIIVAQIFSKNSKISLEKDHLVLECNDGEVKKLEIKKIKDLKLTYFGCQGDPNIITFWIKNGSGNYLHFLYDGKKIKLDLMLKKSNLNTINYFFNRWINLHGVQPNITSSILKRSIKLPLTARY